MANYSYLMVPESVDKAITAAVKEFAEGRKERYDIWRHGLPIWIVSERADKRVNQVQIEAVIKPGKSVAEPLEQQVVFTPGAYEDERAYEEKTALNAITRKVPSAEDVHKAGEGEFLSLAEAEDKEKVKDKLTSSLQKASKLPLEETLPPIQYATPFQ